MSSTLVNSYVDNLFVLDVCATQESLTTKLFGQEVIDVSENTITTTIRNSFDAHFS
jgi:hypothetical protein